MQVSRLKVLKVINDTNGKIFAVRFIKKNGAMRNDVSKVRSTTRFKRR